MNFGLLPEGEAEAWIPDGAGGAPVGGQALVHFDVPDAGEAPKLLDDRSAGSSNPRLRTRPVERGQEPPTETECVTSDVR